MGWYLRKSVNFGGLRLNLSKSGLGFSTGIRGFRVGVNSRGQQYVHCGTGGIYYRKNFGPGTHGNQPGGSSHWPVPGTATPPQFGVGPQQIIAGGNVAGMVDASAADLLSEIRQRHARIRLHLWGAILAGLVFLIGLTQRSDSLSVLGIILLLVATPLLWFFDRRRKQIFRTYNLEPAYADRYRRLLAAFDLLRSSNRAWNIESLAPVYDGKYHAGASNLINRTSISPSLALPAYFKSNIVPPMIHVGRRRLYFFPDDILVFDGSDVGSVGYGQLQVTSHETRFIETDSPPGDSRQVGQTWQYVNKSGGPDRRFSNNRQLPIMAYEELRLQSSTGLNAQLQISRAGVGQALKDGLENMPHSKLATHLPAGPAIACPSPTPWPKI